MKEKLTQMCTHSEMQTETAHVDDEAIKNDIRDWDLLIPGRI